MIRNIFETISSLSLFICLMFGGIACSDNSQQEIELGQAIVTRGLDAWEQGKSPDELESAPESIQFHDEDWAAGAALIEYEILKTWIDADQTPRCQVRLKVRYGSDEPKEVRCAYQIVREPNKIVARDPMS